MGGVRARVSPQTILNGRSADPSELEAFKVTMNEPLAAIEPVMIPVAESRLNPSGSRAAENTTGRFPVTGIR